MFLIYSILFLFHGCNSYLGYKLVFLLSLPIIVCFLPFSFLFWFVSHMAQECTTSFLRTEIKRKTGRPEDRSGVSTLSFSYGEWSGGTLYWHCSISAFGSSLSSQLPLENKSYLHPSWRVRAGCQPSRHPLQHSTPGPSSAQSHISVSPLFVGPFAQLLRIQRSGNSYGDFQGNLLM